MYVKKSELNRSGKKIKIEIDLPEEIYNVFSCLCKLKREEPHKKALKILLEAINSADIINF